MEDWRKRTLWKLRIVDALVVTWAVVGAYIVRFGYDPELVVRGQELFYVWFSILLAIVWFLMLGAWNSRQSLILGSGAEEYKRVATASLWLFGSVAVISYVLRFETARGYVGFALPAGLGGLLLARWFMRQHLSAHRQTGSSMSKLLIVGGPGAVTHLTDSLARASHAGYLPTAAYLPGAHHLTADPSIAGLPVAGTSQEIEDILTAIESSGVDAVAVSAGVQLHPQIIRHLGWELAGRGVGMIMAPALTDIAGPRIHTQQVAGLPLVHVTTPSLEGGQRVAKRMLDIVFSGLLILPAAPLMAVIALLIKLDSPGGVFFRQERVGIEGAPFKMIKFRSMVSDAEVRLAGLAEQNQGSGLLFKMKNDPRVTRIGAVLRKYSLDELPQLFNIFGGSMSLVGPRPPLPREVEAYESHVRRRLLVKPGLTGLWQVSGRSNLSWQDSVRLDLYYVENWSLTGDLVILFRTFRAVFRGSGAY